MKRYSSYVSFVINFILISLLCLLIYYRPTNKIEFIEGGDIQKAETIDSLQRIIDSLHAEALPCQIELGRYQVAYEIFMGRNPIAAKQYGTIISQETE